MRTSLICALLGLSLASPVLQAQSAPGSSQQARSQAALTAQMFYQLLLGEMSAARGDVGSAVSLLLDAARKTGDEQVYKRATDLALSARAGETALQSARSWRQAHPRSLDANRYLLQILVALNRVSEAAEPLKSLLDLTPQAQRSDLIGALPALMARASDKKLAGAVVEQALASFLEQPAQAAAAWTTVARMRAMGSDFAGADAALARAQAVDARHVSAALLAVELLEEGRSEAETRIQTYLASATEVAPEVRLGYARGLVDAHRVRDAQRQLERLTQEHPQRAEGWLLLGTVLMDTPRLEQAEAALVRFLELAQAGRPQRDGRSLTQARLMLSQVAQKRGQTAQAEHWLDAIDDGPAQLQVQLRRASLLASQGRLDEALALVRSQSERAAGDGRTKLLTEVQLLRDGKRYAQAHDLLAGAVAQSPQDTGLIYEKALISEKLGRLEEMEALLRRILQIKPDHYAAYNALGYSLADRGVRLEEARTLIRKALEFAPHDAYIQDSLAWVEFRLGNRQEALRIIEAAFEARPDAEIAAHFGEILWSLGQQERARQIWREGLALNAQNETLQETLKRLQVQP